MMELAPELMMEMISKAFDCMRQRSSLCVLPPPRMVRDQDLRSNQNYCRLAH